MLGHQDERAGDAGETASIHQLLWAREGGMQAGTNGNSLRGFEQFCPLRLKEERDESETVKEQTHLHH